MNSDIYIENIKTISLITPKGYKIPSTLKEVTPKEVTLKEQLEHTKLIKELRIERIEA